MPGRAGPAAAAISAVILSSAAPNDLITRNVATLADTPKGQPGRPSKSLTLDQAIAVITAASTLPVMELRPGLKDARRPAELMHAYIALSPLAGIRTEEARALHWAHINLDGDPAATPPHIAVWRSVRAHGETKTERSAAPSPSPQPQSRHCADGPTTWSGGPGVRFPRATRPGWRSA